MKERIYISGPMKGIKDSNRELFNSWQLKLEKEGFDVINPHNLGENNLSYKEYMKYDIRALTYCDSIFMLSGWKQSKGACIEHAIALAIGLKIIDYGE